MKMQHKLLFLALFLLLVSTGLVFAQSSANYILQRSALVSGGSTSSANYKVDSVIGQTATGQVSSVGSTYQGSIGFLNAADGARYDVYLPLVVR